MNKLDIHSFSFEMQTASGKRIRGTIETLFELQNKAEGHRIAVKAAEKLFFEQEVRDDEDWPGVIVFYDDDYQKEIVRYKVNKTMLPFFNVPLAEEEMEGEKCTDYIAYS